MNIETVAANLRNTIAGKEEFLAQCKVAQANDPMREDAKWELKGIIKYLEINIDELRRILQDVEQCLPKEHVGESNFEEWYQSYPRQGISKQVARDAYAAGMGDGK